MFVVCVFSMTCVAMKLCTEECRVLGHSDQCWMPPMTSQASSDYRSNLYIPGEDPQQAPAPEAAQSGESTLRKKSFSTFGKENEEEEGQEGEAEKGEDICGTTSLLSEMNSVFQRLLPSSLDAYTETSETEKVPVGVGSLERRKGHLPGKANAASAYQHGVAAWAANTHFQNPGHGHAPASHMSTSLATSPLAAPLSMSASCSKWLPAMEEIPENHEEDELESVLHGKRCESRSEIMDASELVAEINKLLQDVRQS